MGRIPEAVEAFARAVAGRATGHAGHSHNNYANVLRKALRTSRGEGTSIEEALRLKPDYTEARDNSAVS